MTADGRDAPGIGAIDASAQKSDTVDLTRQCRALYVGADGNVTVVMKDGTSATFVGVTAGTLLPIEVRRLMNTGTTATSIVGLY
jgi:hypothetical protein